MRIGFVGLGKMGSQIVQKLLSEEHEIVVTDVSEDAIKASVSMGAIGAKSPEELISLLPGRPVVWLMIPDTFVGETVATYRELLPPGSILIDGGNSFFRDTIERGKTLADKQIDYLDVGTSGGIMGLANGFSLMVGGKSDAVSYIEPILDVLARPHGGYTHLGPSGSGHYVKMVHNGVEYGMMQAYAEGYDLLRYGPVENLDLAAIAKVWQQGSIVSSTLNQLTSEILEQNPELDGIDGYVADSGEGRWTKETAQTSKIPTPALDAALHVRQDSQNGNVYFATKLLAAMRNKFGGHVINKPRD